MRDAKVDDIMDDLDPEGLRTVEFAASQVALDTMAGKTVQQAVVEDTRIAVTMSDGSRYYFYGFMGHSGA